MGARKPNETQEQYKARLKKEQRELKLKLKGRTIFVPYGKNNYQKDEQEM